MEHFTKFESTKQIAIKASAFYKKEVHIYYSYFTYLIRLILFWFKYYISNTPLASYILFQLYKNSTILKLGIALSLETIYKLVERNFCKQGKIMGVNRFKRLIISIKKRK